jgi:homoserine kinase
MERIIRAFAPATVANVSCGFDVLGLAIEDIGDIVEISSTYKHEVSISEIINGNQIPLDIAKNSCSVVALKMLKAQNKTIGLKIRIIKGYTSGSGLGSSAASSAATAVAMNKFLNTSYSKTELVKFSMEGERIASGTAHADNVAAAIFGGICLVKDYEPLEIVELPVPEELYIVAHFPRMSLKTSESREVLSNEIELKIASRQWGNLASFVSGLYQKDYDLISRSMKDEVAEKQRAGLIPAYYEMKNAALSKNALGFGISGSGPSVFAITQGREKAKNVRLAINKAYEKTSFSYQSFISKIRIKGADVINPYSNQYDEIYKYKKQI